MMDPTDARLVTGTPAQMQEARREFRRQQRLHIAMQSTLPELPRSDLAFHKLGLIEDVASGNLYRAARGELTDPNHSSAVGYYITEAGDPIYLERPVGMPHDELNAQHADREERRAQREAAPIRIRGA
jgi:hypothetical protein